jgi:putative addiction module component (TIGR02574 family)
MNASKELLEKVLVLPESERAEIAEALLKSLTKPDPEIDQLWREEAEERVTAYQKGEIKAVSVQDIIKKYSAR